MDAGTICALRHCLHPFLGLGEDINDPFIKAK